MTLIEGACRGRGGGGGRKGVKVHKLYVFFLVLLHLVVSILHLSSFTAVSISEISITELPWIHISIHKLYSGLGLTEHVYKGQTKTNCCRQAKPVYTNYYILLFLLPVFFIYG